MPADARRFVRRVRSCVVAGIPIFERGEYAEAMPGRARQLQRTGKREEAMANIGTLSCSLFLAYPVSCQSRRRVGPITAVESFVRRG
jgi:hypothetical protein